MPKELKDCLGAGGHTTLMVWADCDDDCDDPEALKAHFWKEAQRQAITKEQFERGCVHLCQRSHRELDRVPEDGQHG